MEALNNEIHYINNEDLIEQLMERYGTELKRIAYLYVKDHTLTEDILQEVFISCFKNLNQFRNESSYKTWLIKITVNKCKDALKKWSFRNLIYKETVELDSFLTDTPETDFILKMESQVLISEVLKLPLKFREPIILYYYKELTLEEIAYILNINLNTVKTRLFRARQKLKKRMKEGVNRWKKS